MVVTSEDESGEVASGGFMYGKRTGRDGNVGYTVMGL